MRILLFTGKGGVGKTTVAAATATRAAEHGLRTIVCSTDPAHSLADAFDAPLGDRPTPIANRLFGQQLNARIRFEEAWDDVRAYDPEVVIIAPCGFKIPQSERDRGLLERLPGWSETSAARDGRIFLADGNAFFNRPGPRLVDTAEIVQAAMFGRQGRHRFPAEALRPLTR